MTPDQTAALLAQILAHPRVMAYGEARGWWSESEYSQCPDCGAAYPFDHKRCARACHGTKVVALQHVKHTRYTGPDLAIESNLHELLGLADAMNNGPVSIEWTGIYKEFWVEIEGNTSSGPTRTLAVLAALGRALGIEA